MAEKTKPKQGKVEQSGWAYFGVKSPEIDQKVIYHYEWIGTFRGRFTIDDGYPTFGGEHGSIGAEGCYWMPDNGQDITKLSPPNRDIHG